MVSPIHVEAALQLTQHSRRILSKLSIALAAAILVCLIVASPQRPQSVAEILHQNRERCSSIADQSALTQLRSDTHKLREAHRDFLDENPPPFPFSDFFRLFTAFFQSILIWLSILTFVLLPTVAHACVAYFYPHPILGSSANHEPETSAQVKSLHWAQWQVLFVYCSLFHVSFSIFHTYVVGFLRGYWCINISGHTEVIFSGLFLLATVCIHYMQSSSAAPLSPVVRYVAVAWSAFLTCECFIVLYDTMRFYHSDVDVLVALVLAWGFVAFHVHGVSEVARVLLSHLQKDPPPEKAH